MGAREPLRRRRRAALRPPGRPLATVLAKFLRFLKVALSRGAEAGGMHPASSRPDRAVHLRDAGLRKVSAATRALVVGSVAAAGVFSALAAWAQPGRKTTSAA